MHEAVLQGITKVSFKLFDIRKKFNCLRAISDKDDPKKDGNFKLGVKKKKHFGELWKKTEGFREMRFV